MLFPSDTLFSLYFLTIALTLRLTYTHTLSHCAQALMDMFIEHHAAEIIQNKVDTVLHKCCVSVNYES